MRKLAALIFCCITIGIVNAQVQIAECQFTDTANVTIRGLCEPYFSIPMGCAHEVYTSSTNNADYIPLPTDPVKTVRLRLHIMQKSNGTDNFQQNDPQHMAFLNSIEGELNSRAANLSLPLVGGVQSGAYIQDSRIRFKVLGIYFHQDDIGWTNNGSSCNNYCFANFSVDPEHSLNIFFYGHNIGNGVFGGCGPGMLGECSNFVALQNLYTQFLNSPPSGNYLGGSPWATMPLIFHEIGHCLGLRHSWDSNSQFPDKPTESFGNWCNPTNQSGCSNNVMSYSVDKSYLSPQQVGHIHQLLTGSWRGKLLESCFYDPSLTISVNNGQINTWDWGKTIGGDLIISNNSTLIVKCKISMPEGGKVIVQPGSRLIIDGGSFVNNCDGMWEGIEVWGNANLAQNFTNQGVVELKNGAFIEYAINGIRTIAEVNGNLDWSKTGGIILATGTASSVNCTFKDCWRGIEFMSYHSFNPSNPTTEIKNKSQITNCTFVTTVALPFFSTTPYSHITLYDVNGVAIRDNLFENQRSDVSLLPVDKRGSGIVSIDASYNVLARYFVLNGNIIPASENEFRNLYYGISTSGGTDRSDLIVKDNIFDNCAYSVSLAGCNWGLIGRNIFTVPGGDANITFPLVYDYAFGVHTNGAYGFNIEDNTFNDQSGNIFPNQAVHVINSSSVTSGQVYLNTVNGTSFGTQTQSNNSALKIDCNDYNKTTHSGIDIHAANGVLVDQGSCLFINDVPANNTFSGTCNNSNLAEIYKSSSVPNFSYSYLSSGSFNSTCTNISSAPCTQQNGCPTSITNPVITPKPSVIFAYKSAILQYNEDVAAKSLLIDNGNTQGLLNIIASQNPGNVKNALINASPYLSDEVLIAYLNTNPPHGNMKQIIIANSPVTPTVMNIIDGMNFPNGIRNQINAAQTGISERAKLEASIKYSRTNKLNALDGLIREYLDTNWVDSAVVYLKTEGSLEALCALVPLQIRRDTIDVKNHFTALLAEADLREVKDPNDPSIPEIRGFCDFHLFLMKIVNRPGGYFSMTSSEIAFLKSVANSNLVVAINAQSILNFINHYLPPLVGAYLDEIKSMAILDDNSVATVPQVPFELYPNPTIGVLNISYNFRENEKLLVEVFDITGKLVSTQSLNNSSSIINLSGLNEGLFMVRVYSDGKLISTKKVIYAK